MPYFPISTLRCVLHGLQVTIQAACQGKIIPGDRSRYVHGRAGLVGGGVAPPVPLAQISRSTERPFNEDNNDNDDVGLQQLHDAFTLETEALWEYWIPLPDNNGILMGCSSQGGSRARVDQGITTRIRGGVRWSESGEFPNNVRVVN